MISGPLGEQLIGGLASETGQSKEKTSELLGMALPLMLGAMKRNASSPQGAEGLFNALSSKHDGGLLDNLGDLFSGGVDHSVHNDGAGILKHVLGAKQTGVEQSLSAKTGMDTQSIAHILKIAAPILMGMLGRERSKQQIGDTSGLDGLLGGFLGGKAESQQSLISSLLDADGDGSMLDDVAGMMLGDKKKKGGLLGGLFGK